MATDPELGVVDPDGKAHTVADLYIADSAVFPISGYANPLLTTVAWALRVADKVGRAY
jgi:choline dehydrogenase-like flavoprotein